MNIASISTLSSRSAAFSRVTDNGFCIGCGGCAARPTGDARMAMNDIGLYEARLSPGGAAPRDFASICPFSGEAADEDQIADELFPERETRRHPEIGRYAACFVGHAEEGGFRRAGSSGGMASWFLCELLATGAVDGVVHVAAAADGALFRYSISTSLDAVRGGAKSRYYPVEASQVLAALRETEGRFAFVGVPCFVKAVNLQRRVDATLRERIALTVGIFCGHMKSARFADFLSAQMGVAAEEIASVDFRLKYRDRPASSYGFEAIRRDGSRASRPMAEMFGGNWGYGLFKAKACGFCDDVAAETADIAFGDAWLAEHVNDSKGTNVVVVRDPALVATLTRAASAGRIRLAPVSADTVALSQAAGLRDRREGLGFRSWETDAAGEWRPLRRTPPCAHVPETRRKIYRLRDAIARASHSAFAETLGAGGGLADFERAMRPLIDAYDALYRPSWMQRARRKVGRIARRLLDAMRRKARA
jgi:coenzyme F420-reducing hydrogenase beta subunit